MNWLKPALICLFTFVILSCSSSEQPLDLENIEWKTYRNRNIGFELKFPAVFKYDIPGNGHHVFFSYNGTNTLLLRYTTEEEGLDKGLWFGNDEKEIENINGINWTKYNYEYMDGSVSTKTKAYVIPLNDKYFGIEFRTAVADDAFQKYVLNSVKLLEPAPPKRIIVN